MRDRVFRLAPVLVGAALLIGALAGAAASAAAAAASASGANQPSPPAPTPSVKTGRSCYLVGQSVKVTGTGFADSRAYDIAIDGVDFGQSKTTARGSFAAELQPGGLAAGVTQAVDSLNATDGTVEANTSFTLTRPTGALFTPSQGTPTRLGHFQVWDMGSGATVYLHYVHGRATKASRTVTLGTARGACGAARSGARRLFPFHPADGSWTLQLDTDATYAPHPSGPVARVRLTVG